jgi:hypothetical protein
MAKVKTVWVPAYDPESPMRDVAAVEVRRWRWDTNVRVGWIAGHGFAHLSSSFSFVVSKA